MLLAVSLVIDSHGSVSTVMAYPRLVEALKETWIFKPTVFDGSDDTQWKDGFEADLQSRGAEHWRALAALVKSEHKRALAALVKSLATEHRHIIEKKPTLKQAWGAVLAYRRAYNAAKEGESELPTYVARLLSSHASALVNAKKEYEDIGNKVEEHDMVKYAVFSLLDAYQSVEVFHIHTPYSTLSLVSDVAASIEAGIGTSKLGQLAGHVNVGIRGQSGATIVRPDNSFRRCRDCGGNGGN
jgi:hypothetical protein